jgi:hypothetical protein
MLLMIVVRVPGQEDLIRRIRLVKVQFRRNVRVDHGHQHKIEERKYQALF